MATIIIVPLRYITLFSETVLIHFPPFQRSQQSFGNVRSDKTEYEHGVLNNIYD